MPERETIKRARNDAREGKAPSTQAGEFVREEIEHVREGKHGARSTKQAIAIGLSKARRAGVRLPAKKGTSAQTRAQAKRDLAKGRKRGATKVSAKRSRAVLGDGAIGCRQEARAHACTQFSRHFETLMTIPPRKPPSPEPPPIPPGPQQPDPDPEPVPGPDR